jgi:Domain of unknown function (DUF4781)
LKSFSVEIVIVLYGPDGMSVRAAAAQAVPSPAPTPGPAPIESQLKQALASGQSLKAAIAAAKTRNAQIEEWLIAQAAIVAQEQVQLEQRAQQGLRTTSASQLLQQAVDDVTKSDAISSAALDQANKTLQLPSPSATPSPSPSPTPGAARSASATPSSAPGASASPSPAPGASASPSAAPSVDPQSQLGSQIATQLLPLTELAQPDAQHGQMLQEAVLNVETQIQLAHEQDTGSENGDSQDFRNALTAGGMIAETKILSSSESDPTLAKTVAGQLLGQDLVGIAQSDGSGNDPSQQSALENLLLDSAYAKTVGRGASTYGLALQTVDGSNEIDAQQKSALETTIVNSQGVQSLGPDTVTFLKGYLGTMQHAKANPNDLDAVAAATYDASLVSYGDASQNVTGTKLDNLLGAEMGMKPDHPAQSASDKAALQNGTFELYEGDQLQAIQSIAQHIEDAGPGAQTTLLPVLFDPHDGKAGIEQYPLWRVTDHTGQVTYVDYLGRTYSSVQDFIDNNKLGFGKLIIASDGRMSIGHGGRIDTITHDHSKGFWDYVDQYGGYVLDGAALVGGVVLLASGFGAPIGGLLIAGSWVAMGAAGAYGAMHGVADLVDRGQHGQSWTPGKDTLADYVNIAAGLAAGVGGAAPKVIAIATRAGADGIATTARIAGTTANVANVGIAGYSGYQLATQWDQMSTAERLQSGANLALSLAAGARPALAGGRTAIEYVKTQTNRSVAEPLNTQLARLPQTWVGNARQLLILLQPGELTSAIFTGVSDRVRAAAAARATSTPNAGAPSATNAGMPTATNASAANPTNATAANPTNATAANPANASVPNTGGASNGNPGPSSSSTTPAPSGRAITPRASRLDTLRQSVSTWASNAHHTVQDKLSALDKISVTDFVNQGGSENRAKMLKQRQAEDAAARIDRTWSRWPRLRSPLALSLDTFETSLAQTHDEVSGSGASLVRKANDTHIELMALIDGGETINSASVTTRLQTLQDIAETARNKASGWRDTLLGHLSMETDALARQAREHEKVQGLSDVLDEGRASIDTLRTTIGAGSDAYRAALADASVSTDASTLEQADALLRQVTLHADDVQDGLAQTADFRQRVQDNIDAVYDYVDPKTNKTIRAQLDSQIYVDPTSASGNGMTWKTMLNSSLRSSRNGAFNRFDAERAASAADNAKAAAKTAATQSNAQDKLTAWNAFVEQAVRDQLALDPNFDAQAAGLETGRYQGGATGSVARWKTLAVTPEGESAYTQLLNAARKASASGTRKAAVTGVRAWNRSTRAATVAERIASSVRAEYDAYLTTHGIAPDEADAHVATSPDLQSLQRRLTLTRAASDYAQRRANNAYQSVFDETAGALAALRDTHPAAYRALLDRTANRTTLRAARLDGTDTQWNALVNDMRTRADTASAAPGADRPRSPDGLGDAGLTVQKVVGMPRRFARAGALYHGALMLATGQVVVTLDKKELKKYNVATSTRLGGWQLTIKTKDGLNTLSVWFNIAGIKSLWLGGATPFAFSRDGGTTIGTRDGVSLFEGGVGWRFGLPWLNKLDYLTLRAGYLKQNTARFNFKNGEPSSADGQFTWSWPITVNTMDAIDIGPFRSYDSLTSNRIPLAGYGFGDNAFNASGPDFTKSHQSMITALTLNKESPLDLPALPSDSPFAYDGIDPPSGLPEPLIPDFVPDVATLAPLMPRVVTVEAFGPPENADASTAWGIARANWRTLLDAEQRAQATGEHQSADEIVANYALAALQAMNPRIQHDPAHIETGWRIIVGDA